MDKPKSDFCPLGRTDCRRCCYLDRKYSPFGRSREEMAQKNTIRPVGLQPKAHQPPAAQEAALMAT
jgi:hypothetical protein